MTRINLVVWIMLLGFGGTLSTSAHTLTGSPQPLAVSTMQSQYLLAQYGGDDDDDDDDGPPQRGGGGGGGGGYSAPRSRGGVDEGAIIRELFRGGAQILQQQQRQYQQQQQQQRRNIDAQRARERAAQEARARRQQEEARRQREAREKQQREAREKAERARQIEVQKLKDEAAVRERKNNLQNAVQQEKELQDLRDKTARKDKDPDDYLEPDEYRKPDKVDDVPVDVVLVPQDDKPPLDDLPELVVGPRKLPACGYVTLPARPDLCRGQTASGGWLRVVNVRLASGGNRTACVSFCAEAPKIAVLKPKKKVPPPVDPPPRIVEPAPKPTYPSTKTVIASNYVEPPAKQKPTYPSAKTVVASDYVEPKPKPTPAQKTVIASTYVEPKAQPKPAEKTVVATSYEEPKAKPKPAEKTVVATNYVEPKPAEKISDRRPTTPAQKTGVAKDPTTKPPEPENPDFGFDSVGDDPKDEQKKTPPVRTAVAKPDPQTKKPGGPDNPDFGFDSAQPTPPVDPCYAWVAARLNAPPPGVPSGILLNEPALRQLEESRRQNEAAAKAAEAACRTKLTDDARKKADEERRKADNERMKKERQALLNPVMDGVCTTEGAKPAAQLVRALPVREMAIGAVSAIPAAATEGVPVGAIIGGIMKMFWKDDAPDQIFDQMKAYVDQMVPEAIGSYDTEQLKKDINDLKTLYADYEAYRTPSTKGSQLEALVRHLDSKESRFLDPRSPEKSLAEFVAFGSLKVAALQELYRNYDKYKPFDPRDPDAVNQHEDDRNHLIRKMNEAVKTYTHHVAEVRKKIMDDRLSKLKITSREYVDTPSSPTGFLGLSDDLVDKLSYKKTRVEDDFCAWKGVEHDDDAPAAQAELDRRREAVRRTYNAILDTLLEPVSHWPSAAPVAQPVKTAAVLLQK